MTSEVPPAIAAATVIALLVVAILAERWLPSHPVNRRAEWKRDVLSLVVVNIAAPAAQRGLLAAGHWFPEGALLLRFTVAWPSVARVALSLVLMDFGIYWVHRAMHASNLLWRTHRWHHSIVELYWLSGVRTSVTHAFLYSLPQTLTAFFFLGLTPWELFASGSIGLFFQLYIHSSIDVGLGPLDWLVVTPRVHRLHHSRGETQRMNLGTFFTVWDRMFGTYVDPARIPAPERLGNDEDVSVARMIVGI